MGAWQGEGRQRRYAAFGGARDGGLLPVGASATSRALRRPRGRAALRSPLFRPRAGSRTAIPAAAAGPDGRSGARFRIGCAALLALLMQSYFKPRTRWQRRQAMRAPVCRGRPEALPLSIDKAAGCAVGGTNSCGGGLEPLPACR
jgi:hypothetical protein